MTREELTVTVVEDLRKIAGEMGIKNANDMKKFDLINKMLEVQADPAVLAVEAPAPVEVPVEAPVDEIVYTDRHERPVGVNMRASFRVGGKWVNGTITKMKMIENEQYIGGMLDGTDKTKLFHSTDVDTDVPTGSVPSAPAVKATPETAPKAPKAKAEKAPKEPKAPKAPKAPKEPKVRVKAERPADGSKSLEILEMLENGIPKAEVAKKLGVKYQFVQSISKRYFEDHAGVAEPAEVPAEVVEVDESPELEGNVNVAQE